MSTPITSNSGIGGQATPLITQVRNRLIEPIPKFWTDQELVDIMNNGVKDLWRDIVDLKQEHFLKVNNSVFLAPSTGQLSNLPSDIHKIYLIEPLDSSDDGPNPGLYFMPEDYNSEKFRFARSRPAMDPTNDNVYWDIHGAGAPDFTTPIIRIAPQVTSTVYISFVYVPTLPALTTDASSVNPVPGESDECLITWTLAFARAKERDDRSPDPSWLSIYSTNKQHLLQSLGLRQYMEPTYVNAEFEEYW